MYIYVHIIYMYVAANIVGKIKKKERTDSQTVRQNAAVKGSDCR